VVLVPWVEGVIYYEVLFWGGGHTLQFQHALLMVVAWLWIGGASRPPVDRRRRAVSLLFLVAACRCWRCRQSICWCRSARCRMWSCSPS
jgi:hypothetical protein